MRITVMTQMAKGISKEDPEAGISSESLQEKLKRLNLLIQVRAQVLNQEWSSKFGQWYPGLTVNSQEYQPVLQAA